MAQESKLVSIIIPIYNAAKTIVDTLDSVFEQSYKSIEVIVVNDGSTDDISLVLENYKRPISIYSTENRGVSSARTLGFNKSTGDYIQYLDADDLLMPHKISIQVDALSNHQADVAYGDWEKFTSQNNQLIVTEKVERKMEGDLEIALFTDFWCPPVALLYSRKVCENLKWNENLPVIQDARYFLDAAIYQYKFLYTPGIMGRYRTAQANSLSQKSDFKFVKDLYENTKEVCQIWKADFINRPDKKAAIINSLRHCINRFSTLNKPLAKESIHFLLAIEPKYLPSQKGFLRTLSKIIGYKNAETIADIKRNIKL